MDSNDEDEEEDDVDTPLPLSPSPPVGEMENPKTVVFLDVKKEKDYDRNSDRCVKEGIIFVCVLMWMIARVKSM